MVIKKSARWLLHGGGQLLRVTFRASPRPGSVGGAARACWLAFRFGIGSRSSVFDPGLPREEKETDTPPERGLWTARGLILRSIWQPRIEAPPLAGRIASPSQPRVLGALRMPGPHWCSPLRCRRKRCTGLSCPSQGLRGVQTRGEHPGRRPQLYTRRRPAWGACSNGSTRASCHPCRLTYLPSL